MAGNKCSGRGRVAKERNTISKKSSFTCLMPAWLTDTGKKYWKRNMPILREKNAIGNKDVDSFCRLCELYSRWREVQAVIREQGPTYETQADRGAFRIMTRPEATLELQYNKELNSLEKKFGLTPMDGKSAGINGSTETKKMANTYRV